MSTQIADALTRAADYLDEHGWHQGSITDGKGSFCALGCIARVTLSENERGYLDYSASSEGQRIEYSRAAGALARHLGFPDKFDVSRWNDTPGRVKEDVVRALRDAADLESLDERAPAAGVVPA